MALTTEQQQMALAGPCFALRFLVRPESRSAPREQMKGFSDSAIFHRWMDLCWTFNEPETRALLNAEERKCFDEFTAILEWLPWKPIESHPHISDVSDSDLKKLLPSGTRLLACLERRTRPSAQRPWWRKLVSFLRRMVARHMKYVVAVVLVGLCTIASWLILRADIQTGRPHVWEVLQDEKKVTPLIDPIIKAKYDRIAEGMTLGDVEEILGKAGPSYSSQIEREYYIWKSRNGWISVIVEKGKVITKDFRPEMSVDD